MFPLLCYCNQDKRNNAIVWWYQLSEIVQFALEHILDNKQGQTEGVCICSKEKCSARKTDLASSLLQMIVLHIMTFVPDTIQNISQGLQFVGRFPQTPATRFWWQKGGEGC